MVGFLPACNRVVARVGQLVVVSYPGCDGRLRLGNCEDGVSPFDGKWWRL